METVQRETLRRQRSQYIVRQRERIDAQDTEGGRTVENDPIKCCGNVSDIGSQSQKIIFVCINFQLDTRQFQRRRQHVEIGKNCRQARLFRDRRVPCDGFIGSGKLAIVRSIETDGARGVALSIEVDEQDALGSRGEGG
ncbi:MAG: hypothetical protein TEF_05340 [Rhizobiales bacterium NRL2]|nr:MAG: hypothetical protein TEF_05340 [Rhizobiales bacterium NRL2]